MHNIPKNIKINPIKLELSLNTKYPRSVEMKKFDAVDITVGTKVLESVEWSPFTKYRQTIALDISMRPKKNIV